VAGIGGLVIIGVVLFLLLVVFNGGGQIKNYAEFKDALDNHKAINCEVTVSGGETSTDTTMTIQADDGWNKIHMIIPSLANVESWGVKEGDKYTLYGSVMGQNVKTTQSASEVYGTGSSTLPEEKVKLDCKPNNQADFTIPDRDWKESSSSSLSF
jgi:hypothetical protein